MKRPNITPGKWSIGINPGEVFSADRNKRIVDNSYVPTECSRVEYSEQERVDNARAIAALPDLLEALEACLLRLDAHDDQSAPECTQARKALIKAGYTLD